MAYANRWRSKKKQSKTTFEDIKAEALRFGLTLKEFYDSTPKDIHTYIEAKQKQQEFDIEQGWDYTRNIMLAQLASMGADKYKKPQDVMRLKRDGQRIVELTDEQKQQLKEWEEEMDKEMGII